MDWLFHDLIQSGENGRELAAETLRQMMLAVKSFSFQPRRYMKLTVWDHRQFQNLKVPTIFIVGENEKIYSPRRAIRRLQAVAHGIRTEMISGGGHDISVVRREMVNEKVLRFLKE